MNVILQKLTCYSVSQFGIDLVIDPGLPPLKIRQKRGQQKPGFCRFFSFQQNLS